MSRARVSPPAKPDAEASHATTPAAKPLPRRKHPWLLALAILLLGGWLAFLAYMAFGL
jgi:hypothetical protein